MGNLAVALPTKTASALAKAALGGEDPAHEQAQAWRGMESIVPKIAIINSKRPADASVLFCWYIKTFSPSC